MIRLRTLLSPLVNALAVLTCLTLCAACDSHDSESPTDSVCPTDNALTYENFGRPFMESYCVRCHHSDLQEGDRQGAPLYHDFDTLTGILNVVDHVDEYTAFGPSAQNTEMPPNGDAPSDMEREQLGTWLACEVAKLP